MKPMMFYLPDCWLCLQGCVALRTIEDISNEVGLAGVTSDTAVMPVFMCSLKALPRKFVVSVDLSHGQGPKLVKMYS
jgi:hypothetical protein